MKLNPIDKLVGYINPKEGLRRISQRRAYEAAGQGRRNKSMKSATSTSANIEIGSALSTLRNRSRHFVRNNGWAKRALTSICDNAIGQGIRPAPAGELEDIKKIKAIWKSWAETTNCDYDGRNTFYGLQDLIMSEIVEAGDCLVVRRRVKPTKKNPIPIQIQVLEGDQLDESRDGIVNGNYCRLGVQFDSEGKRSGYWIFKNHPNDYTPTFTYQSEFVSVEDVLHPFELLRAGQVRGVPMGVASFVKLSDFSDYEDAQLVRQKAAAAFVGFVTGREGKEGDSTLETLEPGIIEYLGDGEQITFSSPPPADGYDTYSKKILQGIASSYGITYEMLTMDYSNVNFTSGRMANINVSSRFKKWQYNMFVPLVCVPVWDWFMDAAIIAGVTKKRMECNAMDWTAPKIQQLDPTKETNARIAAISSGLTSLSECWREDGRDREEFLEEYKQDMEAIRQAGVNFTSVITAPVEMQIPNE